MFQAQASERLLIDQFLAALRSLPEVQAEPEGAVLPGHDVGLALELSALSLLGRIFTPHQCVSPKLSSSRGTPP